ncbi:MAG: anthranilate phosphoribosyltransferase, partial [Sphingomicrobium sp.]
TGGDATENGARLRALLNGEGERAEQDIVALNAGALLMTAGKAADLRKGTAQALDALRSGAAGAVLKAWVEASRG